MYIIYILIIIINLIGTFVLKKKLENSKNEYVKEKKKLIKHYISNAIKNINITLILLNIIFYIITLINNIKIDYFLDIALLVVTIISFIIFLTSVKKSKKSNLKLPNDYVYKHISLMVSNTFNSLICLERVGGINNINLLIFELIPIIYMILNISFIIIFLRKIKNKVCFGVDEKNFVPDIKFYNKINISMFYNCVLFIFAYILLGYVKLPYAYIGYILVIIILGIIIKRKIEKIKKESDNLYNQIAIAQKIPGVEYAFDFYRDILLCKRMIIVMLLLIISTLCLYICSDTIFTYISIDLYIIYLYELLRDKNKLITNIYSLNDTFMDKKIYKINLIKEITYIDNITINILNIKLNFYKLIYVDLSKNVYESNLVLYDPEIYVRDINLYINPENIDEYVIMLKDIYE